MMDYFNDSEVYQRLSEYAPKINAGGLLKPMIDELKTINSKAAEQLEHQKIEIERLDNLNRHAAEQLELLKSNFEEEKKERIKTSKQAFIAIFIAATSLLVNAINAAPIIKNFIISLIP